MTARYRPAAERGYGFDLLEPKPWAPDDCVRREPVIDPNFEPPRIVRHVGWRPCMCCGRPFWSEDVKRQRFNPLGCSYSSQR